jgi:Xaa-Pro aminopeptidase
MNPHLSALMKQLPDGIDAALIESGVNRRYFTGFPSTAGALLVFREEAYFLIDFRYIEAAKEAIRGCTVIRMDHRAAQFNELLKKHNAKTLAIESTRVTVADYELLKTQLSGVTIVADGRLDSAIARQRAIKSREEFDTMCRAAAIADRAFTEILNDIRVGVSERFVADTMIGYLRKFGGDGESFDTIAVSGPNTSRPHGVPGSRLIEAGDFFTLDFGTVVDGYDSDMTRTVAVGSVTDEMRRVYDTVRAAQEASFAVIRAGVPCKDVDAAARRLIDEAGYRGCFGHGLGHSLGLEIHEPPNFAPSDQTVAKAGMLLSVEPGIYLEGRFGVRIEDTVWITEDGFLNLAHSPKELLIL